ncbi:hypothetical protein NDU88_004258 [Pleurodeles waltl]|uniref:Uncharacterized protein n=1 Tax=Pleurodeles waltl TaxID=8319 RepID=A0AAV7MSY9_PLEWA|nr:hypothetical protein NDU88_004258 [Pleurodeles waltl]
MVIGNVLLLRGLIDAPFGIPRCILFVSEKQTDVLRKELGCGVRKVPNFQYFTEALPFLEGRLYLDGTPRPLQQPLLITMSTLDSLFIFRACSTKGEHQLTVDSVRKHWKVKLSRRVDLTLNETKVLV